MELTQVEYDNFAANLLDDYPFIEQNLHAMYVDTNGVYHCIYVKAEGAKEGVLCESEGYSFYAEKVIMQSNVAEELILSIV